MSNTVVFRAGAPTRPNIVHDNGFLDKFALRAPTVEERMKLFAWRTKLSDGEFVNFLGVKNIPDALDAYRHFIFGNGRDRTFSYKRFVYGEDVTLGSKTLSVWGDPSGQTVLLNARSVAREGAEKIYRDIHEPTLKSGWTVPFSMTSDAIVVGGDPRFPYPKTENWQKAIGGHSIWISAFVTATADKNNRLPKFTMVMTIHAEDRYNFNPGQKDIVTGIPDEDNGLFEITGLAKQYTQYATLVHIEEPWNGAPRMRPR